MQELRPKGMDVRQDELGDLVDKEMAATSAAIEEAVRRIDVSGVNLITTYNEVTCDIVQSMHCNCKLYIVTVKCHMVLFLGNDESGTKGHNRSKTGG